MVIFQLEDLNVPITLRGYSGSYDERAAAALEPALRVAFDAIYAGIVADIPTPYGYVADKAKAWYDYIQRQHTVRLLHHSPPEYVPGRIY